MTELSLILGLVVGAMLFIAGLLRWLLSLQGGGAEARRLCGAVQRAAAAISWRQVKRSATLTTALALLTLCLAPLRDEPVSERAGWLVLGLAAGAAVSLTLSQAFLILVTRGASRAANSIHGAIGHAVACNLRTGTVIAMLAEIAALLLVAVALIPLGTTQTDAFPAVRLLLGGLTVGALVPALLTHLGGGAVYFSGQLGRRDSAFRTPRYSYQLDARNPTMVLDVVGTHLGQTVVRGQSGFCSAWLMHVAALLALLGSSAGTDRTVTALLGLPLVIRAVGLIACGFAVMSTRVDDADDVLASLYRGLLGAAVLGLTGIWGASYWLLGDSAFLPLAMTGSVSLLGATLVSFSRRLSLARGAATLRGARESAQVNPALGLAATLGSAFLQSLGPLGGILVSLLGLYVVHAAATPTGQALAVVIASFAAAGAYSAALANFEPVTASASSLSSMDERYQRPEFQSKVSMLRQSAQGVGAVGLAHGLSETAVAGFAIAWLLWPQPAAEHGATSVVYALLGGFCGTALVLGYSGAVITHLDRTARGLKLELQRQLRGFGRDPEGYLDLPKDFRPRYKDHLDLVGSSAFARTEQVVAFTLMVPLTIGLAIATPGAEIATKSAGASLLMAFVGFATLTGLCISLLSSSATAIWGCAIRDLRLDSTEAAKARALIETNMCLAEVATPMAQLVVASAGALGVALLAMLL